MSHDNSVGMTSSARWIRLDMTANEARELGFSPDCFNSHDVNPLAELLPGPYCRAVADIRSLFPQPAASEGVVRRVVEAGLFLLAFQQAVRTLMGDSQDDSPYFLAGAGDLIGLHSNDSKCWREWDAHYNALGCDEILKNHALIKTYRRVAIQDFAIGFKNAAMYNLRLVGDGVEWAAQPLIVAGALVLVGAAAARGNTAPLTLLFK